VISFRKKILITYTVLFVVFTSLTFPFVSWIVRSIAETTMQDRADELIAKITSLPNDEALIRRLKEQKPLLFFRVSIINNAGKIIYNSKSKNSSEILLKEANAVTHPDVLEAFKKGTGYSEDFSELSDQKFFYFSKTFNFHDEIYVIRIAFPYNHFSDIAKNGEIAFLIFIIILLLLFSALTWFIIHNLTSPIQQIINAASLYGEDKQTVLPEIKLKGSGAKGEFGQLATTLNSLSDKIQKHIDKLTAEWNEKEAILESLVEGVVAIDKNMIVTYANNMALQLLGTKRGSIERNNFSAVQQPQSYALLQSCQKEQKVCTGTSTIIRGNTKIYLDIVAVPIKGSNGAILVMQDKSSHYKLLEMRKDFIANASHELKTPITIIRGFAEMLHDNPEFPRKTTEEITGKIMSNCQRMSTLISDLLTLSDVENIPLSRLSECNLPDIVQMCCDTVQEIYPEAQINIRGCSKLNDSFEEEFMIQADPSLMELAFINLIDNAAKYSISPAKIDISFKKIGSSTVITVADQGIGIPEEDLEHIFDRFYTVNKAHSKKLGGSGLGLSIVQTIIQKHFGQISITSTLGKGTTFTINL